MRTHSPRRPGERRDPYTPAHVMRKVRKRCGGYTERWLWVPAFAGTTALSAVRPTAALEYWVPACAGMTSWVCGSDVPLTTIGGYGSRRSPGRRVTLVGAS